MAEIRSSFLKMFVSIFKRYPECINEKDRGAAASEGYFDQKKFLDQCGKDYRPFAQEFTATLIFRTFLDKKQRPEKKEDMLRTLYFDENIVAKFNRQLLSSPQVVVPLS